MKKKILLASSAVLLAVLSGCSDTSTAQLSSMPKPIIVFSKHKATEWWDNNSFSVKDKDGDIIELEQDNQLVGIVEKYNVGDTIK